MATQALVLERVIVEQDGPPVARQLLEGDTIVSDARTELVGQGEKARHPAGRDRAYGSTFASAFSEQPAIIVNVATALNEWPSTKKWPPAACSVSDVKLSRHLTNVELFEVG
jgi:hypothetical protein